MHGHAAARHQDVRAAEQALLAQVERRPSWIRLPLGSSAAPVLAYEKQRAAAAAPSMSIQLSTRVAPVWAEMAYSSSLRSPRVFGQRLQARGAMLEVQRQQAGRPTRRA
jgi:hypothetical protein